ncbi:MAG: histidine kinase [Saprospirales bacterium]|nr:histidine kinase [Saprospirales bacterium]
MPLRAIPTLIPLFFLSCLGVSQSPAWRNYTIEDGLPDNTVFSIMEDSEGYMWFCTDAGICRFNGYEFRQFPGPGDVGAGAVYNAREDEQGRVWFRTSPGYLYYVERDTIKPWKWNSVVERYRGSFAISTVFDFREDKSIVLFMQNLGILQVWPDGSEKLFEPNMDLSLVFEDDQQFWLLNKSFSVEELGIFFDKYYNNGICQPIAFYKRDGGIDTLYSLPMIGRGYSDGARLGPFHLVFRGIYGLLEWKNGKPARRLDFPPEQSPRTAVHFLRLRDGRIYIPTINKFAGLYVFRNVDSLLANRPDTCLLRGVDVSGAHIDRHGALWVSTLHNGIFYLPNPEFSVWDKETGLEESSISHLSADGEKRLFFGSSDHRVFQLDLHSLQIEEIPRETSDADYYLNNLYFDTLSQRLIAGSQNTKTWIGKRWEFMSGKEVVGPPASVFAYRIFRSRDARYYYGYGFNGLDVMRISDQKILNQGYQGDIKQVRLSALTETPSGKLWAGLANGLHEWKGDMDFEPLPGRPAPLENKLLYMIWAPDSTLIAGTASGGLCFWKDDFFRQVTTEEGLTSNRVSCIAVEENGTVWASGNQGLNRISGWKEGETLLVEPITIDHGLPSNQVNDLCMAGDALWIATGKGLVRLRSTPERRAPLRPLIESIWVNGEKIGPGDPSLPFDRNHLEFRYYALNYRQNGRIPYRFRLKPDQPWKEGTSTKTLFSSLAPGDYRFEVQARNEFGEWSESTVYPFLIRAPWWETALFRASGLALLLGAGFLFYRLRTSQLKARFALRKQLSELEQTAIRAQMNPHFIFNCLNSIQRCIADNDAENAMRYLARFARLVRSALELSGRSAIPLSDELAYLENYLELEKMRFKEKFNYRIEMDERLDLTKNGIPPMLVQPLAENAIHHGFAGMQEGGKLDLFFDLNKPGFLTIQVRDNGRGMEKQVDKKSGQNRELHALGLIRRRLDLLSASGEQVEFHIESAPNEDGSVAGTAARLRIPLVFLN